MPINLRISQLRSTYNARALPDTEAWAFRYPSDNCAVQFPQSGMPIKDAQAEFPGYLRHSSGKETVVCGNLAYLRPLIPLQRPYLNASSMAQTQG